jgi:hypothetical protein
MLAAMRGRPEVAAYFRELAGGGDGGKSHHRLGPLSPPVFSPPMFKLAFEAIEFDIASRVRGETCKSPSSGH